MVAGTLKDIDAAVEDEEVDEDDPALLSELQEIAGKDVLATQILANSGFLSQFPHKMRTHSFPGEDPETEEPAAPTAAVSAEVVATLTGRLQAYEALEKGAREAGDTSKAKRFARALKTLGDLLKTAQAGG